MTISAVVLTKNEENRIIDCLESVSFCDQIVVIDDNSRDNTRSLVKNYSHKNISVFQHSLDNNFSQQRNFGLGKVTSDWALFIDADERISLPLQKEIQAAIKKTESDGYIMKRNDIFIGIPLLYGETGNISLVRLAKKNAGVWKGSVHETWEVLGTVQTLSVPLEHLSHKNISDFLEKINRYSTMRAEELYIQKKHAGLVSIITYPFAKFIKNYIVLKGYKDGTAGFIHAVCMSFHSFLVRGKLYLLWKGIKNTS